MQRWYFLYHEIYSEPKERKKRILGFVEVRPKKEGEKDIEFLIRRNVAARQKYGESVRILSRFKLITKSIHIIRKAA